MFLKLQHYLSTAVVTPTAKSTITRGRARGFQVLQQSVISRASDLRHNLECGHLGLADK